MVSLTFSKCCCCFDLRRGAIIIAIVTLGFESISLIIYSILAKCITMEHLNNKRKIHHNVGVIYAMQFLIFLFLLTICLKFLLSIGLLIGLFKRLPDHLEMWYKGYLVCVLLQGGILICGILKYKADNPYYWLLTTERLIIGIVTLYFIMVVRSYYYKMCKEVNYYQNMMYTEDKARGKVLFTDTPGKKEEEAQYETIPSQIKVETQPPPPKYGHFNKRGGEVYSAPKNISVGMPTPIFTEVKDKQSSALYPSLP